jgi:hypothetical protein
VNDLVAYDETISFLGDETVKPERLRAWISGLSAFIRRYVHDPIETATFTETIDGSGETTLRLPYRPIVSVTALSIDGVAVTVSDLVVYADEVYLESGFPAGRKNVAATWTAGHGTTVPEDMKLAVMLILEQAAQTSLLQQATRGEYAYVFAPTKWPKDAREIIDSYRRKL